MAAKGDSLRHTMKWPQGSDVSRLKGRSIVLKFHLDRSRLFSFVLPIEPDCLDLARGYVATQL